MFNYYLTLFFSRSAICGSDGRSYGNECQMKEESCRRQQEIFALPLESCQGNQHRHSLFLLHLLSLPWFKVDAGEGRTFS